MNRTEALELLYEYTKGESLRKHALAVEAAMRAYARHYGEDEEAWAVVGLLHDFDYEMYPEFPDHPTKGSEILTERGLAEDLRTAILSHVPRMQIPRQSRLAQHLFACDELCGFITAAALVRPGRLSGMEPSSVKKKLKDKAFARSVSREEILKGTEEAGLDLTEHIRFVIAAMSQVAPDLGLA